MKADLEQMLAAKRKHREGQARAPIAVKLAKLDALRERAAVIRESRGYGAARPAAKGRRKRAP